MTTELRAPLAIVDADGALVELPDATTALAIDDAERIFGIAQHYLTRLRRIAEVAKVAIENGWTARGQREGILGGEHYVMEAKPGPYTYRDSLHDALAPFVGKVFDANELLEATGRTVVPEHVEVIPEAVFYAYATAKLDALARRSQEVAAIVAAHRERDEGTARLTKKVSQ